MVGLKTFWIILSTLFLFAACVPQTKQTECKTNEAFNASLRTCVPVVGGPSSFINIANYTPMFTQSRTVGDGTPLEFRVTVSNPYNQSYTIGWERVYNAAPVDICSNSLLCTISPGTYQVGTHIITAKIKDGNGSVVDTHSFELKIDNYPRPAIVTSTITPASYAFDRYPTDSRVQFSFTIRNPSDRSFNLSDNYRTVWTVTRNGSLIYTESDSFTSLAANGTSTAYLGTPPTPYFNPASFAVGSYIVRAVVQNDVPGEIIAEQQWNVIIKQPDLANVTNITGPAPGIVTTAYNNTAYNQYPTLNWIYSTSPVVQPNFCVSIDDRDGTYPLDGKSIQVRWYLDGIGGEICTKKTLDTPGTQVICLIDGNTCEGTGAVFDTSLLKFSNANSVSPEMHKVTARLFDEATTYEFERSDVIPSNGSYPIEWRVNNKPVNTAPVFNFGSTNPSGCVSSSAFARSNCLVNQGQNFTVSFTVSDDHYTGSANPGEFQWNVNLKLNGGDITTPDVAMNTSCSKAFNTAATLPVARTSGYTTEWTCSLNVPHYTATGPLDPSTGTYQVVLTGQDQGSPVGGTGLVAQSLTWNLVVTETNPATLALAAQTSINEDSHVALNGTPLIPADPTSFARETETVLFRMNITDLELDDLRYRISLCTDNTSACATSVVLTSPAYVDFLRASQTTQNTTVLVNGLLYTLPEDLLIGRHSSPIDVDRDTSRLVYFKVDVQDKPSVGTTTVRSVSRIFQIYVRNFNPAPVINTATASPAVGTTSEVYAGYPFTIDPGSVTDSSSTAAESDIRYQWFARIGAGAWTTITGASSRILRYTPGNISSTIELRLCVGDNTAANTISSTGTCSGSWFITPKRYLYDLSATGSGSLQNEMAVWFDDTNTFPNTQVIYSAYADANRDIFVEKTIKNTTGDIVISTETIRFPALATGLTNTVSNLSISGSADSVYVAYIASASTSPSTMIPRIRRIDKRFDLIPPSQTKASLSHPAPFGFNYTHYGLSCAPTSVTNCVTEIGNGQGGTARITFNAALATGDTLTINGVTFTAVANPSTPLEICDSSSCTGSNSMADYIRDKVNNSLLPALQGITARSSGGIVELYGQYHLDFLDFDGNTSGVPGLVVGSNGLGKIFVTGGRWHLPMINASLGGAEQNNVTVLSGTADVHLRSIGTALNTNDVLTEMGKTALFDAKLNTLGQLVFARISSELSDAGAISLYRYNLIGSDWNLFDTTGGSATDQNSQQIFGSYSFEYVKLAADNTSNPYYYVIGREKTVNGGKYLIGRYNHELDSAAAVNEHLITARLSTTDSTSVVITNARLKFPDVVSLPGFPEARLFFHSVGSGTVPYPRIARWKADNTITCGTCFSLNRNQEHQETAYVAVSQVAHNITLGAAGATASQNVKDVVFTLFSTDTTNTDVFKPQLGIINIESEAIQSTAVNNTGLFQPPFVLD